MSRARPALHGEPVQMMHVLLWMVGDMGLRSDDAATWLGARRSYATEVLGVLRDAGQAELVICTDPNGKRSFIWCEPCHADAIRGMSADAAEARRAERAQCSAERMARRQREAEKDDEVDPFYRPVVHRIVPAHEVPPIYSGEVRSVFDWGAAA